MFQRRAIFPNREQLISADHEAGKPSGARRAPGWQLAKMVELATTLFAAFQRIFECKEPPCRLGERCNSLFGIGNPAMALS